MEKKTRYRSVAKEENDPKYRGIYRLKGKDGFDYLSLVFYDPRSKSQVWRSIGREELKQSKKKSADDLGFYKLDDVLIWFNALKKRLKGFTLRPDEERDINAILRGRSSVTFKDIFYDYLASLKNEKVKKDYLGYYKNHIENFIGDVDPRYVNKTILKAIYENAIKTLDYGTIQILFAVIRAAFNAELNQDEPRVDKNPVPSFLKQYPLITNLNNVKDRTYTIDEIINILTLAKSDREIFNFCLFAVCFGGRGGAIASIKNEDINLKEKTIRLIDEKAKTANNKEWLYTIPIANILIDYLTKEMKNNKKLINVGITTLRKETIKIIDKVIPNNKTADRKSRLTIHSFRSFAITQLLNNGCPEYLVKRFSNHSQKKREAFNRYTHAELNVLRPYVDKSYEFLTSVIYKRL
ncbi:MAG: site-specific integrase [Helicobacteraceae bacterium]|jgi:integrase|nr:site-specific integrase [Helicobacteraceae bacterium]